MTGIFDKKDQSIRELKVLMKKILNEGTLDSLSDAYQDKEYMEHAKSCGLVDKNNKLLDFYTKTLPADELEHVIPKGKGGNLTIANCIPVASHHNPRRGYTDEPMEKLKRVCKDLVREEIDYLEVQKRYTKWQSDFKNETIDLEPYEETFLKYQLIAAKCIDTIIDEYCHEIGKINKTPNSTTKYEKKLKDHKIK